MLETTVEATLRYVFSSHDQTAQSLADVAEVNRAISGLVDDKIPPLIKEAERESEKLERQQRVVEDILEYYIKELKQLIRKKQEEADEEDPEQVDLRIAVREAESAVAGILPIIEQAEQHLDTLPLAEVEGLAAELQARNKMERLMRDHSEEKLAKERLTEIERQITEAEAAVKASLAPSRVAFEELVALADAAADPAIMHEAFAAVFDKNPHLLPPQLNPDPLKSFPHLEKIILDTSNELRSIAEAAYADAKEYITSKLQAAREVNRGLEKLKKRWSSSNQGSERSGKIRKMSSSSGGAKKERSVSNSRTPTPSSPAVAARKEPIETDHGMPTPSSSPGLVKTKERTELSNSGTPTLSSPAPGPP
ncbi:hypothetical protein BDK51DRAFT_46903 [Blyttiomyces helicus]|uniref:Uncharacterized protein n=1 Tax=Blyttiomyces helicus TaxID=388810 RepID=A0A4V1IR87_9FUNG|nr:hypothetical protein BDK51DRAFT_46903 [Blyttiomyces helicus]|eukprot:RKO89197.1 hypothetical protein BDK51DRAFT_46903 [Blyttiomyces helicus]